MLRARRTLWTGVLVLLLASCSAGVKTATPDHLRLRGSEAVARLLRSVANSYTQKHPQITIEIEETSSKAGLQSLLRGEVDIALVSGPLTPEEAPGLRIVPIGYDSIAIVVKPDNPVYDLTPSEIHALFAGDILNWSQVGGENAEVQIVSREDGSGTRAAFESLVMGERRVTRTALVAPGADAMCNVIAADRNALGYLPSSLLDPRVRAIRIHGVDPTPSNLENHSYPLTLPLLLVTRADPSRAVADFVGFVLSPAGQQIVSERCLPLQKMP